MCRYDFIGTDDGEDKKLADIAAYWHLSGTQLKVKVLVNSPLTSPEDDSKF